MNNCKHYDFDCNGNPICKIGGTCSNPDTCKSKNEN